MLKPMNLVLSVIVLAALSAALFAQTPAAPGAATAAQDLSGVWDRAGALKKGGGGPGQYVGKLVLCTDYVPCSAFTKDEPPMTPWGAELYHKNHTDPNPFADGKLAVDPAYNCFPPGPTRLYTMPRPFQIVHQPGQVLLLFEQDHWVRRIYTDGRQHPQDWPFGWMGHSIGKWDGDTFVVDTTGLNDRSWIDGLGHPHSDALHVVERFRRTNHDTLQIDFIFDDPKVYTRSWTGKKVYALMPNSFDMVEDVFCEDVFRLGMRP